MDENDVKKNLAENLDVESHNNSSNHFVDSLKNAAHS